MPEMHWKTGTPLEDVITRSHLIVDATRDVTFDQYASDLMLQAQVERHLEVVGEALNRLSRVDANTFLRLPDARRWVNLRNAIAHLYDDLSQTRVWNSATVELSQLHETAVSLLEEFGEPC